MLAKMLSPLTEVAHALLRFFAGAMFLCHGLQKHFGVLQAVHRPEPGSQHWWGGILEIACGTAVALGVFTRLAAFLASGMMAVAYVQFHWKPWDGAVGENFFPIVNQGELALLYSFVFLSIACRGPGILSIDSGLSRPRLSPPPPRL